LALDLLDELTDLGGGGFRLFALNADEGSLVFPIIEKDVENAVGHQRDADDCDEQHDVFGEQASASFYDRRFGRRLLLKVSASGPRSIRGTQILGEIQNPHGEHGIKRWPILSRSPRRVHRIYAHARPRIPSSLNSGAWENGA
jgi:hypothetical protein